MFQIKINDNQVRQFFIKKSKNAGNFKKILSAISPIIQEEVKESFEKQRDPVTGSDWKKSRSPITLQKDGHLLKDMKKKSNYRIDGEKIRIFTTVLTKETKKGNTYFYGSLHNNGIGFVQRRFAGISPKGFQKIFNKITEII